MSDAFELEICQGKYRYRYEAGKQEVWRNGEPWEVMNGRLIGDKFVFSLAIELDEAIKERDALRTELSKQQALTDAAQHIAEVAQRRADKLSARAEEAEKERDALRQELDIERGRLAACGVAALGYFTDCAQEYRSASLEDVLILRAKIEQMEQQEPVAEIGQQYTLLFAGSGPITGVVKRHGLKIGDKLYALPGAKGDEK